MLISWFLLFLLVVERALEEVHTLDGQKLYFVM